MSSRILVEFWINRDPAHSAGPPLFQRIPSAFSALEMGASHLSCCSTLFYLGHRPEERRFMSWSITEEKERKREFSKLLSSSRWFPEGKFCFLGDIRLVNAFGENRDLVLSPSRSDLVVQSSRFAVLVGNREILNLSMVSGPAFKKMKRTNWIFIPFGDQQMKKKRKRVMRSVKFWSSEL